MKKKSAIALILTLVLLFLTSCGSIQVKEGTTSNNPDETHDPVTLRLVYASKNEKDANIVRDMLTKKGFIVEMNPQADNSGVQQQAAAGNYDIIVHASGNAAYSADYALKYFIYPGGALNWSNIDDDKLTAMIDNAGTASVDQWDEVFSEIEQYMVDDMVYSTPLYQEKQGNAVSACVDPDSFMGNVTVPYLDYIDASLRDTRALNYCMTSSAAQFPTLDPVRYSAGVTGTVSNYCYANLIRIDTNNGNSYTLRGTITQAYSIAETNQSFYFLLRDDCFFSRVDENGNPYVTDRLVAGEDVVYSLLRAADPDSVIGNTASSYFTSIDDCVIVTDIDELKNTKNSAGVSIYDELNAGAANTLTSLAATRDGVDGSKGAYQVVRLDTKYPFIQVLNYLNQHSAGILDSEWVEEINSKVDAANYNADKDWLYGDTKNFYPDANFYNDCSFSGPYVITTANDYGLTMVKNEGFAVNGDPEYDQALIKNVNVVYAADSTAAFTALRSGDVDVVVKLGSASWEIAQSDSNLHFILIDGSGVHFIIYNRSEDSVCSSLPLRKAISAAINQEDVITAIGAAMPANSVISAGYVTTHTFTYDDTATEKYMEEYWASGD